jgi:hypothetical protein
MSDPQVVRRYSALSYPSDSVGRFSGRVVEGTSTLAFVPGPFLSFRLWSIAVIIAWGILCFALMTLDPKHKPPHAVVTYTAPVLFTLLLVIGLMNWVWRYRRASKLPYIVVDRLAKRIELPRQKRGFAFADVVRLQFIHFGTGRHHWPGASDGELQIVFREADRELTWCVLADAYPSAIKQFLLAVRTTTEISISTVGPTLPVNNV